jgi:hypothetical protein
MKKGLNELGYLISELQEIEQQIKIATIECKVKINYNDRVVEVYTTEKSEVLSLNEWKVCDVENDIIMYYKHF